MRSAAVWCGQQCPALSKRSPVFILRVSFTYYLLMCPFPTHVNFFKTEIIAVYHVPCMEFVAIMGLLNYEWIPADSPLPWCPCAYGSVCRAQHFTRRKLGTGDQCWQLLLKQMAFLRFLMAALLMSVGPARRDHKAAARLEMGKVNLYLVRSFLNKLHSLHAQNKDYLNDSN